MVDELATSNPEFVFAQVPRSSQFADGLIDVTIHNFASAVDRAAFWLESLLGKSDDSGVIAYLGPSKSYFEKRISPSTHSNSDDLRYLIFAIAARKVGYQVLLIHSDVCELLTLIALRLYCHPLAIALRVTCHSLNARIAIP